MSKRDFINYLECEFSQYQNLTDDCSRKEKKQFINGLMKASRFFGVSYDELNTIVDTHRKVSDQSDNYLDIPAFIRQAK